VQNGEVRKGWKVIYTEDRDDSTSGKELKEQGYTLPEYHFTAEYGEVKSEQSPVMEVKDFVYKQILYGDTKEPAANISYTLYLPDGTEIEGQTNEKGYMQEYHRLPFGPLEIILRERE
jgi:hypothetical protein